LGEFTGKRSEEKGVRKLGSSSVEKVKRRGGLTKGLVPPYLFTGGGIQSRIRGGTTYIPYAGERPRKPLASILSTGNFDRGRSDRGRERYPER